MAKLFPVIVLLNLFSFRASSTVLHISKILQSVQDLQQHNCLIIVVLPSREKELETAQDAEFPKITWNFKENPHPDEDDEPILYFSWLKTTQVKMSCRAIFDLSQNSEVNKALKAQRLTDGTTVYQILTLNDPIDTDTTPSVNYFVKIFLNLSRSCLFCGNECHFLPNSQLAPSPHQVGKLCLFLLNGSKSQGFYNADESLNHRTLVEQPHSHCERNNFLRGSRCTKSRIFFYLLASRLNLTFLQDSQVVYANDELDTLQPALVVCANICRMEDGENLLAGTKTVLFEMEYYYALYCTPMHSYEEPEWSVIFTAALDPPTALCLLITSLVLAALFRRVRVGLDVFFVLLGQTSQSRWPASVCLVGLMLSILNQYYQADVTTSVTAPLNKETIPSVVALFSSGYKFILPDNKTAMIAEELVKDRYAKLGIPLRAENVVINDTIVDINDGIRARWFSALARYKWAITITQKHHRMLQSSGVFHQNRLLNVSCYVIRGSKKSDADDDDDDDQHVLLRKMSYMVRGWMRDGAYSLLKRGLDESGISLMWDDNANLQDLRISGILQACHHGVGNSSSSSHCSQEDYKPLSFHSPFKILLYWQLGLCCLGLGVMMLEISAFYWAQKRNVVVVVRSSASSVQTVMEN